MPFVDFLLNLAGLLLWLNWCSVRFDPVAEARASTLAGTLKKTERKSPMRWAFLAAVVVLVVLRALAYWHFAGAVDWMPALDFGTTVLPFRSDHFNRALLFSAFSLGRVLIFFYAAVVFLTVINRRMANTDPFQKLVRQHLGPAGRWPSVLLLLLAAMLSLGLWLALHPLLARLGIAPRAVQSSQVFQQGLLVLVHELLALRFVIAAFLFAHLVNSYVYLGTHAIWGFVNETGRNLLRPLRWLPLRLGRVDFAPVVMIALVFAAAEVCAAWIAGHPAGWLQWLMRRF